MKDLKDMTLSELKREFRAMYETVYIIDCYGTRDVRWLEALEEELRVRGYEADMKTKIYFRKIEKGIDDGRE